MAVKKARCHDCGIEYKDKELHQTKLSSEQLKTFNKIRRATFDRSILKICSFCAENSKKKNIRDTGCNRCELGEMCSSVCVTSRRLSDDVLWRGENSNKLKYLLITDSPDAMDNREGLPMVSKRIASKRIKNDTPGDKLEQIISSLDINTDEVIITNAVKCKPPTGIKLKAAHRKACLVYLLKEIARIKPDIIICLGLEALRTLAGTTQHISILRYRLKFTPLKELIGIHYDPHGIKNIPVTATYHPGAIFKDITRAKAIQRDLRAYCVSRVWEVTKEPEVKLINTEKEYASLITKVKNNTVVSFDCETTGLAVNSIIVVGSFCFPLEDINTAYVVLYNHNKSELDDIPYKLKELAKLLLAKDKKLVGQHLQFDIDRLLTWSDINIPKCKAVDSEVISYILDESPQPRNLNALAVQHTNLPVYKDSVDLKDIHSVPLSNLIKYAGIDAVAPPLIIKNIVKKIKGAGEYSTPVMEYFYRVGTFVSQLKHNGVNVNVKRLKLLKNKLEETLEKIQRVLPDLNFNSWQQVKILIEKELGREIAGTSKDILEGLVGFDTKEPSRVAGLVLDYRKYKKELGTYVNTTFENLHIDGMVHPSFFLTKIKDTNEQGGTVSRISIKDPALQTFPKKGGIRKCFISRYEDEGLILCLDASQIELRRAAEIFEDPVLMDIFIKDLDPHSATGKLAGFYDIYKDDPDEARFWGKQTNFTCIFGASQYKLEEMGLSPEVAEMVHKKLSRSWRVLYQGFNRLKQRIVKEQKAVTEYGSIRHLWGANFETPDGHKILREGANYVVQRSASDFMQLLGWYLGQHYGDIMLPIMTHHDEIDFDIKKEDGKQVIEILKEAIPQFPVIIKEVLGVDIKIPYKFELTAGPNWGTQKVIREFTAQPLKKAS